MIKPKFAIFSLIPATIFGILFFWYITAISNGQYQPLNNIHVALAGFAWVILATSSVLLSVTSIKKHSRRLSKSFRILIIILNGALILVMLFALALASSSLKQHILGRNEYRAAQLRCGASPLIGDMGFGSKSYIRPGSKEYHRLKYTVGESHIFGPNQYFCSEDEAKAQGYRPNLYQ